MLRYYTIQLVVVNYLYNVLFVSIQFGVFFCRYPRKPSWPETSVKSNMKLIFII